MANLIRFKRASGSDPSASDLVAGEPAVRTDTGELFFKKDDGSIAKVAGAGGGPDFKYLALRNSANNGAASYPNADFTLVTSGTTTALTPTAANTLLVSVNGVIQKPNTGTSTPSEGFALSGSTIKFGANISAAPDFILYQESGGIGEPSDDTVSEVKLKVSNSPVNGYFLSAQSGNNGGLTWAAPVATSCTGNSATATALATARAINGVNFDGTAAITVTAAAGTLSGNTLNSSVTASSLTSLGDLGGLTVNGDIVTTGNLSITSAAPQIFLTDSNANSDFAIVVNTGQFRIRDETNSANRLAVNSDGHVDIYGRLDAQGGLEVTGVTTTTGRVNIGDTQMSSNLLNVEDGTAAAIDIASHGIGGDTAYIGVKKSTGGGLTFGISNRDIIFKTGATYSNGTTFDSGTEAFRIHANRRLSIGTDSADASLHIKSPDGSNTRLILEQTQDAANYQNSIDFKNAGTQYASITAGKDSSNNSFGIKFTTGASFSERMVIHASGNIGMATATPQVLLDAGGASSNGLNGLSNSTFYTGYTNSGGFGGIVAGAGANGNSPFIAASKDGNGNALNLFFQTNGTIRQTIDTVGRVGIGTTSVSKLLHIKGDDGAGTQVLVQAASGTNSAGIQFDPASGDTFEYQAAAAGLYVAYNRTDNRSDIFVLPAGGVGFATTSLTGLGSQTGNANVCTFNHAGITLTQYSVTAGFYYDRLNFTNSQYFIVNSSGTGVYLGNGSTSFTGYSDERLKTNITELDGAKAYNHVKTARAASFNWNATGYPTDTRIGFIAQDWETNYPEVTDTTSEQIDGVSNPKGIQYTETIPVLMAALKQAIAKIETLETKVAALEAG